MSFLNWVEVGKGQRGSIFVKEDSEIRAVKQGKTVGGLQIWELRKFRDGRLVKMGTVYLKRRSELKEVIERF